MIQKAHRHCYGAMFPDPSGAPDEASAQGKVFHLAMVEPRGLYMAKPRLELSLEDWDECLACADFDGCYRLSMARAVLQSAVSSS